MSTDIRTLEGYTLRSWPALETHVYDGWMLRFAEGYTRRSNSTSPLDPSSLDVDAKIAYVEGMYLARGLTPRFKLTPDVNPPELDSILEAHGYVLEVASKMMKADLSDFTHIQDANVVIEHTADGRWFDLFCQLNPSYAPFRQTMTRLIAQAAGEKYFATVMHDDMIAAVGLGVREGEYVGLYDIVTAENLRGRGFGKQLVRSLLAQAVEDGAKVGYLQVMSNNTPAIKLYTGMGYIEAYPYWYRSKQV